MMDHDCVWKYAEYSMFYIEDASDKYELHIGGYSGNAGMLQRTLKKLRASKKKFKVY